jgi:hypothetical protein
MDSADGRAREWQGEVRRMNGHIVDYQMVQEVRVTSDDHVRDSQVGTAVEETKLLSVDRQQADLHVVRHETVLQLPERWDGQWTDW